MSVRDLSHSVLSYLAAMHAGSAERAELVRRRREEAPCPNCSGIGSLRLAREWRKCECCSGRGYLLSEGNDK